jgi:SAM-dependent methyltransferase
MNGLHTVRKAVNVVLRPLDVQLVRGRAHDPGVQSFIPARKTIVAAERAGLTVGDYLDQTFAEPGATRHTVEAMLELAGLNGSANRVCEIGAGSGRYLEAVTAVLHPTAYEVYEPAEDWARHLQSLPAVVMRHSDGRTLRDTATASVDLVHAQKVFVYLDFATLVGYFEEMARVVRAGGAVAFDVVTEGCLDDATVAAWSAKGSIFRPVPRAWILDFLERRGLTYVGHHIAPLPPGTTELLVFRRDPVDPTDT